MCFLGVFLCPSLFVNVAVEYLRQWLLKKNVILVIKERNKLVLVIKIRNVVAMLTLMVIRVLVIMITHLLINGDLDNGNSDDDNGNDEILMKIILERC